MNQQNIIKKSKIACAFFIIGLIVVIVSLIVGTIIGASKIPYCRAHPSTYMCGAEFLNAFPSFALGFTAMVLSAMRYYNYRRITNNPRTRDNSTAKKVLDIFLLLFTAILSLIGSFFLFYLIEGLMMYLFGTIT